MKSSSIVILIALGLWFALSLVFVFRPRSTSQNSLCDQWLFATNLGQPIDSLPTALQAYAAYAPTTPLYQGINIPTSVAEFRQKFNLEPYWDSQTVLDENGTLTTLEGYNMVLSHFITPNGNVYKYQMCRQGKPIN